MAEPDAGFRTLQYRFAAHLRDPQRNAPPEGLDDRRLAIYRELFFNNVAGLLAGNFPVLRSLHDEAGWQALVRAWFAQHRARTPLFPELGREFVHWLQARAQTQAGDPPWFAELAHYEFMEIVAANHEADLDALACDPAGDLIDGVPVVSPLAFPLVYRFAVHTIGAATRPAGDQPPPQPTCLIVVCDRSERVGFMVANALTVHLIEALRVEPAPTGREALRTLAQTTGVDAERMLAAGGEMLERLRARDVVLGSRRR
jgi:uncharacterized protein